MTRKAIALLGAALTLGFSGAAFAQSATGGMNPAMMTCGELAEMDEGRAEGAVYFVAGYQSGEMGGITGTTGTAATTGDTGATTGTTGTGMAGSTETASVDFERISVEDILSACQDSPERMVSDVVREHSQGTVSQ